MVLNKLFPINKDKTNIFFVPKELENVINKKELLFINKSNKMVEPFNYNELNCLNNNKYYLFNPLPTNLFSNNYKKINKRDSFINKCFKLQNKYKVDILNNDKNLNITITSIK